MKAKLNNLITRYERDLSKLKDQREIDMIETFIQSLKSLSTGRSSSTK